MPSRDLNTVLIQFDCNGSAKQQFRVLPRDGGYIIVANNSGLVLAVSTASAGEKIMHVSDKGPTSLNQHWNLVPVNDGSFKIRSALSGLIFDVTDGSNRRLPRCPR